MSIGTIIPIIHFFLFVRILLRDYVKFEQSSSITGAPTLFFSCLVFLVSVKCLWQKRPVHRVQYWLLFSAWHIRPILNICMMRLHAFHSPPWSGISVQEELVCLSGWNINHWPNTGLEFQWEFWWFWFCQISLVEFDLGRRYKT